MRYERLCVGSFHLGGNTPRTLFGQQRQRTRKVVRTLFGGVVYGEMESYSTPPFQSKGSAGNSPVDIPTDVA